MVTFLAVNYVVGYGAGRFFKLHPTICRTVSIEVAMQNDWLALHIVRGTRAPMLYIFPVIFYSAMQVSTEHELYSRPPPSSLSLSLSLSLSVSTRKVSIDAVK